MKSRVDQNPILVTGAHRSGTTFVGKMLALPLNIGYVHEPFHRDYGIEGIDRWFFYMSEGMPNETTFYDMVRDLLNGKAVYKRGLDSKEVSRGMIKRTLRKLFRSRSNLQYQYAFYNPMIRRLLIKDPIACLSSEYFHRVFSVDTVILIRHPAAFVGSIRRLNWRFDFENFYGQTHLMSRHLNPILKDCETARLSEIAVGALLWKCIYQVLFCYLDRNPKMIAVKHEDISCDPTRAFRTLYQRLGIKYTQRIDQTIKSFTDSSNVTAPTDNRDHVLKRNSRANIKRWKGMLTEHEVERIKDITSDLASQYYSDDEW